jgi:putative redox protein
MDDDGGTWSTALLPDGGGDRATVSVDGLELAFDAPLDAVAAPGGTTPMGLLAASLATCTAMSVRTFLRAWHCAPGEVRVRVAVLPGSPAALHREVDVAGAVDRDLREQLAAVVDSTPVTVLLRSSTTIRTVLRTA